jgi:tRNA-specific 2-thiouridylase
MPVDWKIPDTVRVATESLRPGARVAVGLSGGVDSSMAALLLRRAGFDVVGLTMQIWDGSVSLPDEGRSGCFGPGEVRDLEAVHAFASHLDIPHRVVPLAEEYRRIVLDYFREEYLRGRTPNPCVHCNRQMKLGFLLERARQLGVEFDAFATGHYARRTRDPARGRHRLLRARDASKDQTYFLSHLSQAQLGQLVLPLGGMLKDEVRAIAIAAGFPELAAKAESQDFIESRDYGALFHSGDANPGPVVTRDGTQIGTHRGLIHYTIGQRKGLGVGGAGEPWYVVELDAERNRVVVGRREDLGGLRFRASHMNWIAIPAAPLEPARVECRIRQRHAGAAATLRRVDETAVDVEFDEPQFSITPGQIAVFYDGDDVLGGGTIEPAV